MAKLLYIEDHAVFAQGVISRVLNEHEVTWVESLAEARRCWETHGPFEAVVLDYDLPDGKGVDMLSFLRENNHLVPALAMSSHDAGNQELMRAGASDSCSKKQFKEMPRKIQALLGA